MAQHVSARSPDQLTPALPPAALSGSPTGSLTHPADPAESSPTAAAAAQPAPRALARPMAPVSRQYARCDLCGELLGEHSGHFHMVSPLTARHVSVCRTCRRAALGEGYRPRA
jgi:hypothetical protein